MNLTIFSTCKPCDEEFGWAQRAAITSWAQLSLQPEIILFGDEDGVAELAHDLGCRHVPEIAREYGKPLVNVLFAEAQRLAAHDILAYINADIVLLDDFSGAIGIVAGAFDTFLMVSRRWEMTVRMPRMDLGDPHWQAWLREYALARGAFNVAGGTDYHVFRGSVWPEIPPATIARRWYDGWLVWDAVRRDIPVVDATPVVLAIHPTHTWDRAGGAPLRRNAALCGKPTRGDPGIAQWELTEEGLQQR